MTKERMTVLEALSVLKVADKKQMNAVKNMTLIGTKRNSAIKVDGVSKEEFAETARAGFNSAMDLTRRIIELKKAVHRFNAKTEIEVAGEKMTVASAIWMKDYGLALKRNLLMEMYAQLQDAEAMLSEENGEKLDAAAERHAKVNFEGDAKSDKSRYLEFLDDFKEKNQHVLVDPLGLSKQIDKLDEEIAKFEAEVDSKIQIANATNEIEIEY